MDFRAVNEQAESLGLPFYRMENQENRQGLSLESLASINSPLGIF